MDDEDYRPPRPTRRALTRYVVGWGVLGAVTAVLVVLGLRSCTGPDDLPPLRQTVLEEAVRDAGCRLVRATVADPGNPPAYGSHGRRPAPPRIYDRPPPAPALIGAIRRGVIVIHYRPGLAGADLQRLKTAHRTIPNGTIVTPNATGMPYEVAAVGWQRIVGCRRFDDRALDAIRLFRARFIGVGPDVRP